MSTTSTQAIDSPSEAMDGYDQSRGLNSLTNSNISLYYYNQTGDLLRDYAPANYPPRSVKENHAQSSSPPSHPWPGARHSPSSYESDDGLLAETLLSFSSSVPTPVTEKDGEACLQKHRSTSELFAPDGNDDASPSDQYCLLVSMNWCFPIYSKRFIVGRGPVKPSIYPSAPDAFSSLSSSSDAEEDDMENVGTNKSNPRAEMNRYNEDVNMSRCNSGMNPSRCNAIDSENAYLKEDDPMNVCRDDDPLVKVGMSKLISRNHLKFVYNSAVGVWELFIIGKNGVIIDGLNYKPTIDTIGSTDRSSIRLDVNRIQLSGVSFIFVSNPCKFIWSAMFRSKNIFLQNEANANSPRQPATPLDTQKDVPLPCPYPCLDFQQYPAPRGSFSHGIAPKRMALSNNLQVRPLQPAFQQSSAKIKPPISYSFLIAEAIYSAPNKRSTLSGIYNYVLEKYPYYRTARPGWQNSIRHNLSLNKAFIKLPRTGGEPGKGMFWAVDQIYLHLFPNIAPLDTNIMTADDCLSQSISYSSNSASPSSSSSPIQNSPGYESSPPSPPFPHVEEAENKFSRQSPPFSHFMASKLRDQGFSSFSATLSIPNVLTSTENKKISFRKDSGSNHFNAILGTTGATERRDRSIDRQFSLKSLLN